jgi:transcriptional regulator GlxA family with amidase domain
MRLECDLAIARSDTRGTAPPAPAVRLELALRWLAANSTETQPIARLCEYLQVSQMTVNRLFRVNLGLSALEWYRRERLNRAKELLSTGSTSVKEVAYLLGYRHANDFSRAFKSGTGESASAKKRSSIKHE